LHETHEQVLSLRARCRAVMCCSVCVPWNRAAGRSRRVVVEDIRC